MCFENWIKTIIKNARSAAGDRFKISNFHMSEEQRRRTYLARLLAQNNNKRKRRMPQAIVFKISNNKHMRVNMKHRNIQNAGCRASPRLQIGRKNVFRHAFDLTVGALLLVRVFGVEADHGGA